MSQGEEGWEVSGGRGRGGGRGGRGGGQGWGEGRGGGGRGYEGGGGGRGGYEGGRGGPGRGGYGPAGGGTVPTAGGRGGGYGGGGGGRGEGYGGGRGGGEGYGGRGGGGGRGPGGGGGRGGGGRGQAASRTIDLNTALRELKMSLQGLEMLKEKPQELPSGLVKRSGFGKLGKRVKVLVNMFRMNINPETRVWQWDVDMIRMAATTTAAAAGGGRGGGPSGAGGGRGAGGAAQRPGDALRTMPQRDLAHRVLHKLSQQEKWPPYKFGYDGQKILYTMVEDFLGSSRGPLSFQVEVTWQPPALPGAPPSQPRTVKYQVTLKLTAALNIGQLIDQYYNDPEHPIPRTELQALDVALKQEIAEKLMAGPPGQMDGKVSRNGIYMREGYVTLSSQAEAWHGVTESLSLGANGPQLVVDASLVAQPVPQDLLLMVAEMLKIPTANVASWGARPMSAQDITRLSADLKRQNLKINTKHRPMNAARTLQGLSQKSARDYKFSIKEGPEMTVEAYFKQEYKMDLKFPNLPCAEFGTKNKMALPIEVCYVVPSTGRRALGISESQIMIKAAAMPPEQRRDKIVNGLLKKLRMGQGPTVANFGMSFTPPLAQVTQLSEVDGRILEPPRLEYGRGQCINPGPSGSWQLINVPLLRVVLVKSMAVVSYVSERNLGNGDNMFALLEELQGALEQKAIGLPPDFPNKAYNSVVYIGQSETHSQAMTRAAALAQKAFGSPPQIIIMLFPTKDMKLYPEMKRIADCHVGVMTQVLAADKLGVTRREVDRGGLGKKMEGVALKFNVKLGGDNVRLAGTVKDWLPGLCKPGQPEPRVMLMGADVSHATNVVAEEGVSEQEAAAAASQDLMPSIGAVVASTNSDLTRYITRIFRQPPLREEIVNMAGLTEELLQVYAKRNNNQYPQVIIMFRDGVSEGQFTKVRDWELAGIRDACHKIHPTYNPKITFSTVQKRHQTRFFPSPSDPSAVDTALNPRASGNVRPGLVVDQQICNPHGLDYYLNSHAGIQGTNKPAKYSVLADDNGLSPDSLQTLSYWLCHTYTRCAKSVSYAPPAYYAHHAAARGRAWVRRVRRGQESNIEAESVTSGSGSDATWVMHTVHPALRDTMFFI